MSPPRRNILFMGTGTGKSKIILIILSVIIIPVILFAGYTWLTLKFSYSSGERVGNIQKFSKKGWVCKTWEGELAMVPVMGALPEKFYFSVQDEAVAQKLNQSLGKKVSLYYDQHKGVPTKCFGETDSYVKDVKVGIWKTYDKSGKIIDSTIFENGVRIKFAKYFCILELFLIP